MRFTTEQYDAAIEALINAKTQIEPDGRHCAVCGDGAHQAWECHHNPLRAMWACQRLHTLGTAMHDALHEITGAGAGLGVGYLSVLPGVENVTSYCHECDKNTEHVRVSGYVIECGECGDETGIRTPDGI